MLQCVAGFIYLLPLPFTFLIMMPSTSGISKPHHPYDSHMIYSLVDYGFMLACMMIGGAIMKHGGTSNTTRPPTQAF